MCSLIPCRGYADWRSRPSSRWLQSAVDAPPLPGPGRSLGVSAPHLIGHMAEAAQGRFCTSIVYLAVHHCANGRAVLRPHDEMALSAHRLAVLRLEGTQRATRGVTVQDWAHAWPRRTLWIGRNSMGPGWYRVTMLGLQRQPIRTTLGARPGLESDSASTWRRVPAPGRVRHAVRSVRSTARAEWSIR